VTLPEALRRFAKATFIERPSDPPEIDPPLPRRRERGRIPLIDSVVVQLADRLRHAYASNARF
jgi:hypothetical protein